jgi:hypothetical protein
MSVPSAAAISAGRDLLFGAIVETADLAASYARSAAEAAWRGDELTVRVHLGQLRLATIEAIRILNELVAESADARAA